MEITVPEWMIIVSWIALMFAWILPTAFVVFTVWYFKNHGETYRDI